MTSLYVEHFGLTEAPFSITPNPHFFFAGSGRGSLLEALRYAMASEEGIVTVIGEVGSGKTMLCRMLLDDLPPGIDAIYLGNPSFNRNEILDAIAHELRVPADAGPTRIDAINAELIRRYGDGRRVVLLIDEAHAMPRESLEEVRLLSNLETSRHKLLNIVLFGQPELTSLLAQRDLRQLRERVVQRFELGPLPRGEIGDYLAFRLRVAGHRDSFPFAPAAVELIARCSEGITRRINILADKALLSVFARNARRAERSDVERAAGDAGLVAPSAFDRRLVLRVAAVVLALFGAFVLGRVGAPEASIAASGAASPPTAALPAPAPAAEPPAPAAAVAAPTGSSATPASAPAAPESAAATAAALTTLAEPSLLEGAERDLQRWLRESHSGYTLQVASLRGDRQAAAAELQRLVTSVPDQVIRVHRLGAEARTTFVFYLGDFGSNAEATAGITRLPDNLRNNQPIVRSHSAVRAGISPSK